jgi:protein-S-isoprenylcysteine O-methyltransferase Ste14
LLKNMNPWFAKAAILAGIVGMAVVRTPHIRRSRAIKVLAKRKSTLDNLLVALVSIGLFLPVIWIVTPILAFADYVLWPISFGVGATCLVVGLWLLHRSHVDLGRNWSNTLELREGHELVTGGIFRQIRHPMYSALLLYSLGQVLVVPNWVAGPPFLIAFALLVALRIAPEERMMLDKFGDDYEAYMARTKRLIPGVW